MSAGSGRRAFLKLAGGAALAAATGAVGYSFLRFEADRAEASESDSMPLRRLAGLGEVPSLSILPLIDYFASRDGLIGEPGASWLLRAANSAILFDLGMNLSRSEHPALMRNAVELGIDLARIDSVFISHPHVDHIGGENGKLTLRDESGSFDFRGRPAYVTAPLDCPTASVEVVTEPRIIATGVASLGPLVSPDLAMGRTLEHSLAINVSGKGLVVIVGCGHPGIERILSRAEGLFGLPIHAVIGGLHFPVTGSRVSALGLPAQQLLGTGRLPGRPIDETDVRAAIAAIDRRAPKIVALSAHDSCDWSLDAFRQSFGDRYREIQVGREIAI